MKKPNILILMVDEYRYPPPYENNEIKEWRKKNLKSLSFLRKNGFEFKNHYTASTACSPSRASLYTGQYPSLHGVSQTSGVAKNDFDSDMYWLDSHTVPTFGDYLRLNNYSTYWQGKWHASQANIITPGTSHTPYTSYDTNTGITDPLGKERYFKANNLFEYGFSNWIGPEPSGRLPINSASSFNNIVNGRDVVFANESIKLIESLDISKNINGSLNPWLIVTSFVNPHDIALYGEITKLNSSFNFHIDSSVPNIPKSPTSDEDLSTKPKCQVSYKHTYQKAFQPTINSLEYRKFYYSLQLQVDKEMYRVINTLVNSSFYEDTIIIFTSDHGDMGGAHGDLFQKWHQAYEESIHVPLIFHSPKLFKSYNSSNALSSHVDILPTLLSLSNTCEHTTLNELNKSHTLAKKSVGKNLMPIMLSPCDNLDFYEPIYFMTDDNITKGQNQVSFDGNTYQSVTQPSSIETVIVYLRDISTHKLVKWKFSRYFNNSDLFTNIGDIKTYNSTSNQHNNINLYPLNANNYCDEFEMYNLTNDPIEATNLILNYSSNKHIREIADTLYEILKNQREVKRIYPK